MDFKLNGFSKEMQAKIRAAFENDNKIDDKEAKELGLTKEAAAALSRELSGDAGKVGDYAEFTKRDEEGNKQTITLFGDKQEGPLTLTLDSIAFYGKKYPDADIRSAYLKGGIVILLDGKGKTAKDSNGNPITVDFNSKAPQKTVNLVDFYLNHSDGNFDFNKMIELQILQDKLNSTPDTDKSYFELKSEIEVQKLNLMSYDERKDYITSKMWKAYQNRDFSAWADAIGEFYGYECEQIDDKAKITAAKDWIKDKSRLNALVAYIDKHVDDHTSNLSTEELIWEIVKGVGDSIDGFIGAQGLTMIMGFGAATKLATSVPKIGGILGGAIQAYFGTDGSILIGSGLIDMATAETKEQARGAGANIGLGAIMVHGAKKSTAGTVKILEYKQMRSKIMDATSLEELNNYIDFVESQPYSKEQKQALKTECAKQFVKIEEFKRTNERLNEGVKEESLNTNPSPASDEGNRLKQQTESADSPARGETAAEPVPEEVDLSTPEAQIEFAKKYGLTEEGITPDEAVVLYRKYGLTDADIAELRKVNPDADKWLEAMAIFMDVRKLEEDFDIGEYTAEKFKKEIMDMADARQRDQQLFTLINENNLKWAQKTFNSADRVGAIKDLYYFLDAIYDGREHFAKQFETAKKVSDITGEAFAPLMENARYLHSDGVLELYTSERIKAAKAISDALGEKLDIFDIQFIEHPEKITPDFLAEYKSAKEQLEKMHIEFNSGTNNPVDYLKDVNQAIDLINKTGLDFSWYKTKDGKNMVSCSTLYSIRNNPETLPVLKRFIESCSEGAKEKYSYDIIELAFHEEINNPDGLAKVLNVLDKHACKGSDYEPSRIIRSGYGYDERKNVDWGGFAELLDVYLDINYKYFEPTDKFMKVANGDFKGAANLLKELKSFYESTSEGKAGQSDVVRDYLNNFIRDSYRQIIYEKETDFKAAAKRLQQLKEKGLVDDLSSEEYALRGILLAKDKSIVNKYEIANKNGYKHERAVDELDNSQVSAEEFKKNLELLNKLAEESDITRECVINDERFTAANSYLTNEQWAKLFERIGNRLRANEKSQLMRDFSVSNKNAGKFKDIAPQVLDVIERMIKQDFDAEGMSRIIQSLNKTSIELVDKLVFDDTTRLPRDLAGRIMLEITNNLKKDFADRLCYDMEWDFPKDKIPLLVKYIKENNVKFAEELLNDKSFPKDQIAEIVPQIHENNVDIARRLCTDKDFPKNLIAGIVARVHNDGYRGNNSQLAEILCFDQELNFPKNKIAEILYHTNEANIGLATRLCTDKTVNFPAEHISKILANTIGEVVDLAEKICTDKELNYPPEKVAELMRCVYRQNKDFMEKMVYTKDFSPKNLEKLANYASREDKVQELEQILNTPEIRRWFNENLERINVELLSHLARTQKKLYAEAKQMNEQEEIRLKKEEARRIQMENSAAEIRVDVNALDRISSELVEVGVPEGMAKNAYAKLCADANGNVDRIKLDAVKALIKTYGFYTRVNKKGQTAINPNLTPKDITEIFKLATGDKMSAQNGEFRPQFVRDIISLKQSGVDDIRFAMNLAAVKNMSPIEMKARFKGETRQDIAKRIDGVIQREHLLKNGIDLDSIKEKALMSDKKIEDMKIKEGHGETGKIRSLDSIVGVEKVVLTKFKAEIDQSVWQDEAAFKRWAEEKLADITDWEKHPEYQAQGRFADYNNARREAFEKWIEYLNSEECNVRDDVFSKVLFLDGLIHEMKPDNAYTPPSISHEAFEAVYNQLLEGNTSVSMSKAYAEFNRTKAIKKYGKETTSEDGINGIWVKIPRGGQRGEPLYDEHIAMIQALSEGSSWCLRFENAHTYLGYGDLHFFLTKQPDGSLVSQTAINVLPDGRIREIEKRYNQDRTVPVPYVQVIKEWKEANGFTGMEYEMQQALDAKPEFDRMKVEFAEMQKKGDIKGIFNALGIELGDYEGGGYYIKPNDGKCIGFGYDAQVKNGKYTLFDLGIDEDWLMKDVVQVFGRMRLDGSALTSAPKLKLVEQDIYFGDNKISDLRSLEQVNGREIKWDKPEPKSASAQEEVASNPAFTTSPDGNAYNMKYGMGEDFFNSLPEQVREGIKRNHENRLPDYLEGEREANFDIDTSRISMMSEEETKAKIQLLEAPKIKRIAQMLNEENLLNIGVADFLRDIDGGLKNIRDTKVRKYVEDKLQAAIDCGFEEAYAADCTEMLNIVRDVSNVIDTYNTLTGKYTRYRKESGFAEIVELDNKTTPVDYIENMKAEDFDTYDALMDELTESRRNQGIVPKDFNSSLKTESLESLTHNKEMLDYMYEKYYVGKIKNTQIQQKCMEIAKNYGVRILLSEATYDMDATVSAIERELKDWKTAGKDKAKFPPILDLNYCDAHYAMAEAYVNLEGNIHHEGGNVRKIVIALRHELMHMNDKNLWRKQSSDKEYRDLVYSIMPSKTIERGGIKKTVLDFDNCKYRDELLKIGIDARHVKYAYSNVQEFLAVCAEGDLSKCSPEFKAVLVKLGMPSFVFKLPVESATVDRNARLFSKVREQHPEEKDFYKLAEYVAEERKKQNTFADALFREIFGK